MIAASHVMAGERAMYRVLTKSLVCLAALAAALPTHASSLLTLAETSAEKTRSVVHVGDAIAPLMEARDHDGETVAGETDDGQFLILSTSILAAGADAIPVTQEEVASISAEEAPPPPSWMSGHVAEVIRGRVGDAVERSGHLRQEEPETQSSL